MWGEDFSLWMEVICCHCLVTKAYSTFFAAPWSVAHQVPLSKGFCKNKDWSGLPLPPPGGLPNPGIEHTVPVAPASACIAFTSEPPGKPVIIMNFEKKKCICFFLCIQNWLLKISDGILYFPHFHAFYFSNQWSFSNSFRNKLSW